MDGALETIVPKPPVQVAAPVCVTRFGCGCELREKPDGKAEFKSCPRHPVWAS